MLVCIGITTLTLTTATMDSPGMCLDARGVKLKLPPMLMPMLMLVSCTAFTTPTLTTATMDIPGMCLDVRGVKLKLPLMLRLMLVCRYHYPYFNYGYYGFPRYVFGRKRREAEAAPDAEADAGLYRY